MLTPYVVVNTRTKEVLSRHTTPEDAEGAMLALDTKPHTSDGGNVDLAVADDRTDWGRL